MTKPLVVITGASSGIGAALAKVFSEAGYPVGLIARNLDAMQKLNLPNALCQSVDITDPVGVKTAIRCAEDQFGDVGCLINNAGFSKAGAYTEIDYAEHEVMVNLNVLGVIHGIDAVLPKMQAKKNGTIINISSLSDRNARPTMAVYAATKAAVKSLSESLRMDNAKYGLRICNISPAKILTPLSVAVNRKKDDNAMISAAEFAKIVLWVYQQPQSICIRDLVVAPTCYEA